MCCFSLICYGTCNINRLSPNTSLYMTFLVYVPVVVSGCSIITNTFIVAIEIHLDSATYSCPWEKTCCGRYNPTLGIVWPWALFILIAKHRRTENCFRINLKGYSSFSGGDSWILGIKTCFAVCCPVVISVCMTLLSKPLQINRVPLHNPLDGSRFWSIMMGAFTFRSNLTYSMQI